MAYHFLWIVFNTSCNRVMECFLFYDEAVEFRDMHNSNNDLKILEINLSILIPLLFKGGFFKRSNNG